jgi:tetratricopeptide (TPR) repeat protein
VAQDLSILAELYRAQGRYALAQPLYERSLAIFEKAAGKHYLDVATVLNNLAFIHHKQGQYKHAEPLYKRALAICEKSLDADHPTARITRDNLAGLRIAMDRLPPDDEAEQRVARFQWFSNIMGRP